MHRMTVKLVEKCSIQTSEVNLARAIKNENENFNNRNENLILIIINFWIRQINFPNIVLFN